MKKLPHMEETLHPITPSRNPEHVGGDSEYELLVGHYRTDGTYKSDEQLRTEYIHRTDELINLMTNGVEVRDSATGERTLEKPDYVVWLDKSARPVAWLTAELWDQLAPAPGDTEIPEKPAFRFVNIDREQWVNYVDPSGVGKMDINLIDESIIRSLRSIFMPVQAKRGGLTPDLDMAPTELDNKTVLIVDEVYSSGRTLDIAEKFFKRAFPASRVAAVHWMKGIAARGGAVGNADLPVWYKEKDKTGRGVSNRDERLSQRSHSLTQRLGGWFLSTAFTEIDPSSRQLREEIKHLAHDPNVLIVPSYQRDDLDERAESLNKMNFDEFMAAKQKIDNQN